MAKGAWAQRAMLFTKLQQIVLPQCPSELIVVFPTVFFAFDSCLLSKHSLNPFLSSPLLHPNQVPPELGLIETIKTLKLEGNSFKVPRPNILAKGTAAVMAYLKDRVAQG